MNEKETKANNEYMYKKFKELKVTADSSLSSIRPLIEKYFTNIKEEDLVKSDLIIENKNKFLSKIKPIFSKIHLSMETLEYLFNEYSYSLIQTNKNEINKNETIKPFYGIEKQEIINKLGISSGAYKIIYELYKNIFNNLKNEEKNDISAKPDSNMIIEDEEDSKKNKEKKNYESINDNVNHIVDELKKEIEKYKKGDNSGNNNASNNDNGQNSLVNNNDSKTEDELKERLKRKKAELGF